MVIFSEFFSKSYFALVDVSANVYRKFRFLFFTSSKRVFPNANIRVDTFAIIKKKEIARVENYIFTKRLFLYLKN